MQTRFILPLAAGLALCATAAFAAPPPPRGGPMGHHHHWRMDAKDMAKHFKARCADRYAHVVGGMAYLQTRLDLTAQQKPAFDHWKRVVLSEAKSATDKCEAMTPPAEKPSIVDMAKFQERKLEMRLHGIRAQMPALENLTAKLDQNQDRILARAIRKLMHHRHGHHGDWHHGDWHGHRGFDHDQRWGRGPGGPGRNG